MPRKGHIPKREVELLLVMVLILGPYCKVYRTMLLFLLTLSLDSV